MMNTKILKSMLPVVLSSGLLVTGIWLTIGSNFSHPTTGTVSDEGVTKLMTSSKELEKLADQETIAIDKRLTNDQLSELSAGEIFKRYNKKTQTKINKLFEGAEKSRDYALTLIGKVIPATSLKTIDGGNVTINKKTVIVILNTGDKSKAFVQTLNKLTPKVDVNYLVLFPSENKDSVSKFVSETKLDTSKYKLATLTENPKNNTQPDLLGIAEFYFNAKGVPSYLSIDSNSITFAGNGNVEKNWNAFVENAFKKPYLYNEIENNK